MLGGLVGLAPVRDNIGDTPRYNRTIGVCLYFELIAEPDELSLYHRWCTIWPACGAIVLRAIVPKDRLRALHLSFFPGGDLRRYFHSRSQVLVSPSWDRCITMKSSTIGVAVALA